MNEIIAKENIKIEDMIFEVRGKQVIINSDFARLYRCTNGTKDINKAVSRNKEKFPEDFCFQITKEEYEKHLRFQNGTLKINRGGHRKYLPHVFTEEGVAMLSSILKTEIASQMSVSIMRTFVSMRKYISKNLLEQDYINRMVLNTMNEYLY